jgi:uncharacterized membrane protein YqjE
LKKSPAGIFVSLRRILDGGLALAQKRVELFAVELREEKCRLLEAITWYRQLQCVASSLCRRSIPLRLLCSGGTV